MVGVNSGAKTYFWVGEHPSRESGAGSSFSCGQTAKHAKYEKEVLGVGATLPRLQIQHELTEKTEDRMRLRSLRWLLFKTRSAARSSPTEAEAGAFALCKSEKDFERERAATIS